MASSSEEVEEVPSPLLAFKEYETLLQKTIVSSARFASKLPSGTDLSFQRTVNRKLAKELDACSARILDFANQLLKFSQGGELNTNSEKGKRKAGVGPLKDVDDVLDGYHSLVVDIMDGILEGAVSPQTLMS